MMMANKMQVQCATDELNFINIGGEKAALRREKVLNDAYNLWIKVVQRQR